MVLGGALSIVLALGIKGAVIPEVPFQLSTACFPFHYSLGKPRFQLSEGAYAFACERLGETRREATRAFRNTMLEHYEFNSITSRGVGTHKFKGESQIPDEFYFVRFFEGPELSQRFAVDEKGILYIVWYAKDCDMTMDWEAKSTIVVCEEPEGPLYEH